jgi:hypothetical protein
MSVFTRFLVILFRTVLGGHLLRILLVFQKRPAITHSPPKWQLQRLSKRWIILNIPCGSFLEAEVARCNYQLLTYSVFLGFIILFIRAKICGQQRRGRLNIETCAGGIPSLCKLLPTRLCGSQCAEPRPCREGCYATRTSPHLARSLVSCLVAKRKTDSRHTTYCGTLRPVELSTFLEI